nr:3769_t:CDS:2 [Entrophospora candida]CAG8599975.1 15333_t:CDS:2 [Entrophospora candida]
MATFSFCEQCNNLLYPKEDRENAKLTYACRNCIYQSETSNNCVYRNDIQHPINEANIVIRDLAADPTLPRTTEKRCKQCGCDLAVYFQSQSRRPDTKMTLFYVCANTNCGFLWTDFDPKSKKKEVPLDDDGGDGIGDEDEYGEYGEYEDVGVDHSNIEQQDVINENFFGDDDDVADDVDVDDLLGDEVVSITTAINNGNDDEIIQEDWRNGVVYSENYENPNPPDPIVNSVENIKVEQPTQNTHKDEDW